MTKKSKGSVTIFLNRADTKKLGELAKVMATSRETVIRGLIREGHAHVLNIGKRLQERKQIDGIQHDPDYNLMDDATEKGESDELSK